MIFDGQRILALSETPGEWTEIQTDEGPAILRGYDPSLIEYESVEEHREAKREEIAEGGRASLADSRTRNLDEAQIAATRMIDELARGKAELRYDAESGVEYVERVSLTDAEQAERDAALNGLQAVCGRWNTLLAKIEAATTHADLDAIHWEMKL